MAAISRSGSLSPWDAWYAQIDREDRERSQSPVVSVKTRTKEYQCIAMLLDFHDWDDHIGIHDYSDKAYNWIIYTELEYAP